MTAPSAVPKLEAFSAIGMPGIRSYRLELDPQASIIVGPNGTGKSTFLSLFYLFISRQWNRLNDFDFEKLILHNSAGDIAISKTDLIALSATDAKRTTTDRLIHLAQSKNAINLIYKSSLSRLEKTTLSNIWSIPSDRIDQFRRILQSEFSLSRDVIEADQQIQELNVGQILYLPTYRRIEKDIQSIFPNIESAFKSKIEQGTAFARSGHGFKEIAGFGMSDIQNIMDSYTSNVRDFQRLASETASQEYIKDIVNGKIKKYSLSKLRRIDNNELDEFKEHLDDKLFSEEDRVKLRGKIEEIRASNIGQPKYELRFLGMFVEKLLEAHQSIKERERPLRLFVKMVSSYLHPEKRVEVQGHSVKIISNHDDSREIPLDKLSSGEKQIVSVFAYLLLSGQKDFILLIDEPELSLSVPWQKRFLPDLIDTKSCAHIITVTHSPYVFDNFLRNSVVDVRRLLVG